MTLPSTMQALQLTSPRRLVQCVLPVPYPKPDEVLIRTVATTICTSDINDIEHNPFGIELPRVLGHEGAGVVAAIGAEVDSFYVGEHVVSHPVISCGACAPCRSGLGHLCANMGHLGYDRDGTFAEYYCIPAVRCRPVPASMDLAVAALTEPVAVCIEAVRRGRVAPGKTVLIAGDGPFGLLIARLSLRLSSAKVILVGTEDFRLKQVPEAIRLNMNCISDLPAAINDAACGSGVDVAILAVASSDALDVCLQSLRPRGRLVIFAHLPDKVCVDIGRLHLKELEIAGACNDEDELDEAVTCLLDPQLQLGSLITHRLPFAEWRTAFDLADRRKNEALKVVLML